MILIDTDVLSAFAKIEALPLLFQLLGVEIFYLTPSVWREIEYSRQSGRPYAEQIVRLAQQGKLIVTILTSEEQEMAGSLSHTLGSGEREILAVAKCREGIALSNESRVAHYAKQLQVRCFRIPDLLRALWKENILTKKEVKHLIESLQEKDRMLFTERAMQAIFSE